MTMNAKGMTVVLRADCFTLYQWRVQGGGQLCDRHPPPPPLVVNF